MDAHEAMQAFRQLTQELAELNEQVEVVHRERNLALEHLCASGFSLRSIAAATGISRQRVQQLARRRRDET